jgi:hypothetical protein
MKKNEKYKPTLKTSAQINIQLGTFMNWLAITHAAGQRPSSGEELSDDQRRRNYFFS